MDAAAIIAGVSCAVGILVPLAVFGMHLERRLTRMETMMETLTEIRAGRQAVPMGASLWRAK